MNALRFLVISFLFLSFYSFAYGNSSKLKVGFGFGNSEPYTIKKGETLVGGVLKDMMDELGKRIDKSVEYKIVPRKRHLQSAINGEVDTLCLYNPAWMENPEEVLWSKPLFKEKNIFIMNKKKKFSIKSLSDLKGKKVGTIRGYYYSPDLMKNFKNKTIERVDVTTLNQNFEKLEKSRIDALIDSDILMAHYVKANNGKDKFDYGEMVESSHDLFCYFSKKTMSQSYEQVKNTLEKMRSEGFIDNAIKKYR